MIPDHLRMQGDHLECGLRLHHCPCSLNRHRDSHTHAWPQVCMYISLTHTNTHTSHTCTHMSMLTALRSAGACMQTHHHTSYTHVQSCTHTHTLKSFLSTRTYLQCPSNTQFLNPTSFTPSFSRVLLACLFILPDYNVGLNLQDLHDSIKRKSPKCFN